MLDVEEIDKVSVDADQADALLHLLDAVVIKLEGGTEEDLQVLDMKPTSTVITKDTVKDKEDAKSRIGSEKKVDNRYGLIFIKKKIVQYVCRYKNFAATRVKRTMLRGRRKVLKMDKVQRLKSKA